MADFTLNALAPKGAYFIAGPGENNPDYIIDVYSYHTFTSNIQNIRYLDDRYTLIVTEHSLALVDIHTKQVTQYNDATATITFYNGGFKANSNASGYIYVGASWTSGGNTYAGVVLWNLTANTITSSSIETSTRKPLDVVSRTADIVYILMDTTNIGCYSTNFSTTRTWNTVAYVDAGYTYPAGTGFGYYYWFDNSSLYISMCDPSNPGKARLYRCNLLVNPAVWTQVDEITGAYDAGHGCQMSFLRITKYGIIWGIGATNFTTNYWSLIRAQYIHNTDDDAQWSAFFTVVGDPVAGASPQTTTIYAEDQEQASGCYQSGCMLYLQANEDYAWFVMDNGGKYYLWFIHGFARQSVLFHSDPDWFIFGHADLIGGNLMFWDAGVLSLLKPTSMDSFFLQRQIFHGDYGTFTTPLHSSNTIAQNQSCILIQGYKPVFQGYVSVVEPNYTSNTVTVIIDHHLQYLNSIVPTSTTFSGSGSEFIEDILDDFDYIPITYHSVFIQPGMAVLNIQPTGDRTLLQCIKDIVLQEDTKDDEVSTKPHFLMISQNGILLTYNIVDGAGAGDAFVADMNDLSNMSHKFSDIVPGTENVKVPTTVTVTGIINPATGTPYSATEVGSDAIITTYGNYHGFYHLPICSTPNAQAVLNIFTYYPPVSIILRAHCSEFLTYDLLQKVSVTCITLGNVTLFSGSLLITNIRWLGNDEIEITTGGLPDIINNVEYITYTDSSIPAGILYVDGSSNTVLYGAAQAHIYGTTGIVLAPEGTADDYLTLTADTDGVTITATDGTHAGNLTANLNLVALGNMVLEAAASTYSIEIKSTGSTARLGIGTDATGCVLRGIADGATWSVPGDASVQIQARGTGNVNIVGGETAGTIILKPDYDLSVTGTCSTLGTTFTLTSNGSLAFASSSNGDIALTTDGTGDITLTGGSDGKVRIIGTAGADYVDFTGDASTSIITAESIFKQIAATSIQQYPCTGLNSGLVHTANATSYTITPDADLNITCSAAVLSLTAQTLNFSTTGTGDVTITGGSDGLVSIVGQAGGHAVYYTATQIYSTGATGTIELGKTGNDWEAAWTRAVKSGDALAISSGTDKALTITSGGTGDVTITGGSDGLVSIVGQAGGHAVYYTATQIYSTGATGTIELGKTGNDWEAAWTRAVKSGDALALMAATDQNITLDTTGSGSIYLTAAAGTIGMTVSAAHSLYFDGTIFYPENTNVVDLGSAAGLDYRAVYTRAIKSADVLAISSGTNKALTITSGGTGDVIITGGSDGLVSIVGQAGGHAVYYTATQIYSTGTTGTIELGKTGNDWEAAWTRAIKSGGAIDITSATANDITVYGGTSVIIYPTYGTINDVDIVFSAASTYTKIQSFDGGVSTTTGFVGDIAQLTTGLTTRWAAINSGDADGYALIRPSNAGKCSFGNASLYWNNFDGKAFNDRGGIYFVPEEQRQNSYDRIKNLTAAPEGRCQKLEKLGLHSIKHEDLPSTVVDITLHLATDDIIVNEDDDIDEIMGLNSFYTRDKSNNKIKKGDILVKKGDQTRLVREYDPVDKKYHIREQSDGIDLSAMISELIATIQVLQKKTEEQEQTIINNVNDLGTQHSLLLQMQLTIQELQTKVNKLEESVNNK